MDKDLYRVLQVHPRAEKEVIEAAYRRLAFKYHPDVSQVPDAADRMRQINIAYEVLSDPARRAAYDASLGAARSQDTPPRAPAGSQHPTRAWRALLIGAGSMLLAGVALRLVPPLMLLVSRLLVPLVVVSLVVWLVLRLVKPRR